MIIQDKHLEEIFNLLKRPDCNILRISAPTGSGKTVKIPLYLASKNNKTFVSIPTILAVKSVYGYQQSNSKITPAMKSRIGVAANTKKEEIDYNESTTLVYATSGHIKNKILTSIKKNKAINFCSVLIVDEVHDTSTDTPIILNAYNYAAKMGMTVPKLIMMSATNIEFDFIPQLKLKDYIIEGEKKFNIRLEYIDEIPQKDGIEDVIIAKIKKNLITRGHILVFLPGVPEIISLNNKLNDEQTDCVILQLHSGVRNNSDVHSSYGGKKKIILSTNIAENSITIEGVSLVIDTLLEKITKEASIEGSNRLVSDYISKNSAIQRMGRTGRTMNGKCIRLCTEEFYSGLQQETKNELDRLPLHKVVLSIISYGLDARRLLIPKYKEKVIESLEYLDGLNLIEDATTLNDRGKLCNRSIFSFNNTLFVDESTIKEQLVIIFSIIESLNLGLVRKQIDIEEAKNYETFLHWLVELWNRFFIYLKDKLADDDIRKFCFKNGINMFVFKEVLSMIRNQLTIFGLKKESLLNYESIKNYLYKANNKTILKSKDVIINKAIKVWPSRFENVLILNSFQSGDNIIVIVFLPYGKKVYNKSETRYGFGNYFSLDKEIYIIEEEKNHLLSLI